MANPKIRQTSHQIEDIRLIPEMDMVPFHGGMDIVHETYQLPLAAYSDIQNMRPMRPGFKKRKGQIVLHTAADGANKVMTVYGFSKGARSEIKTFAQMSDGDVLQATANPPTVTTGAFGSSVHTATTPADIIPASWATIRDMLLFADGSAGPFIYSGEQYPVASFYVYKSDAAIPNIPIAGIDYTAEVTDSKTTTVAILSSLGTLAEYDAVFIRTLTPARAFNFTMGAAVNATAAVSQIHYWNGAWTLASTGWSDGTDTAGASFAKTGQMAYTMPTDHVPHYLFGETGYWYRLSLSSGALDSSTEVVRVTYESSWMPLQNIWDGVPESAIEAYVYVASSTNYEFYAGSSISLDAITSSDKIYFNSYNPIIAFYVTVQYTPNANAATMSVKYSTGVTASGTSFTAVSNLSDGTAVGSISLAKDGWVTFTRPTNEEAGLFQASNYMSYWYEISFSAPLSEDMTIGVETMPYHTMTDFGNCYALSAFKRRIAYAFENLPGYIAISGAELPACLNGEDFFIQDVGDGRYNKVTCLKRFYNELLVWQEEKGTDGGCLTLIEGYSAETFGKRIISTLHGTFSAKSAIVIEDVPTTGKIVMGKGGLTQTDVKITAAYFLCRDGVFVTDGRGLDMISLPIQSYFDPNDSKCIRRGYEKEHWISWDSMYQIIRIGLVSGPTATVPNIFLAYDIKTKAWSHDVLGQKLSCHAEVEATSGQSPLLQIGGGVDDGFIYLLNTSLLDVAVPITAHVVMEFDGGGHTLHLEEIVLRVSGSCNLIPYADDVAKTTIPIVV